MRKIKLRYVCKDATREPSIFMVFIEDLERAELDVNTYGRIKKTLACNEYTGLHDKNGKGDEVYDSDIIFDGKHKCNRKVVFEDGCYYADRIVPTDDGWSNRLTLSEVLIDPASKVIGNIYENKLLLKEERSEKS